MKNIYTGEKIARSLTKFQEAQLAYALSNEGNFDILAKGAGQRKFRRDALNRVWTAFIREGIMELVTEGNLTHGEFTCKARDYIDTFNCTVDFLYKNRS